MLLDFPDPRFVNGLAAAGHCAVVLQVGGWQIREGGFCRPLWSVLQNRDEWAVRRVVVMRSGPGAVETFAAHGKIPSETWQVISDGMFDIRFGAKPPKGHVSTVQYALAIDDDDETSTPYRSTYLPAPALEWLRSTVTVLDAVLTRSTHECVYAALPR